jgi:tRNA (mo5U34)-methyltransferase
MSDLDTIRIQRQKMLSSKDIAPLWERIRNLPEIKSITNISSDKVTVTFDASDVSLISEITNLAIAMKPWRKGPFLINSLFIDSEWQSFIKYNLLRPHFNLKDKVVGDIGCNNGYYLFKMLEDKPAKLVGFDPSALFFTQFSFINHFIKSDIIYELLGVEHLGLYEHKFDTLFCLGVLYHRSDPVATLKSLYKGLNSGGELILDTFMIDGDDDVALVPNDRYSKIPNVYFVPTVSALSNWCKKAGFSTVEILDIKATDATEQRKTSWIDGQSLEDFLDSSDITKTIEGYPAPKRVYIRAIKTKI